MGTAKEGARDGRLRTGLHAEWMQQQDQEDMAAVVAGMQRGWRKPDGNAFLDDEYEVRAPSAAPTDRRAVQAIGAVERKAGGKTGKTPLVMGTRLFLKP